MLPDLAAIEAAAGIVHAAMPPTPAHCWPLLASRIGAEIWVKHENHTPIGAFKLRGARLVYMDRASPRRSGSSTRTTRRSAPSSCAAGWSIWTGCAARTRRRRG